MAAIYFDTDTCMYPVDSFHAQFPTYAQHGEMRRVDLWITLCESSPTRNCFLFASTLTLVSPMLLLVFLVFCILFVVFMHNSSIYIDI
jgi:hypothetical protein